jgi:hypothetical protein
LIRFNARLGIPAAACIARSATGRVAADVAGSFKKPLGAVSHALLACLLLAGCASAPRVDRRAEFQGAIASIPKEWSEEPVVVLSDSVNIRFLPGKGGQGDKDGNQVQHRQATWYYVQHRNPTALDRIVVADFKSIETTPVIRATAYWPDGGSWSPGLLDMPRVRYAEEELHSSDRWLTVFRFPKYVQGMLIRVEVSRVYQRPEFLKSEILRDDYPSLSKVVSLALPPGSGIRHGLLNAEGLPVDSSRVLALDGQVFTVAGRNLPKLEGRAMPRNPETWFAALHFSLPARGDRSLTWQELGDTYLASIAAAFETTPELEKLAGGLPMEQPDSLIRRVYSVLRGRIRYHADLEILHTFVPRKAGVVLAKGYGDCKEMSTLMTQLLRIKAVPGVKVGVALISTPGNLSVVPEYPTLGGFNHMIVYAEYPDGSIRYFDPTVKHGDPEDSYYDLIDRTSLVLKDGASHLKVVPMAAGFRNRVETKNAIRKAPGGKGWTLVGKVRLEGQCAFSLLPAVDAAMGEEKGPLLKTFLKELFAVDATEARLVSSDSRSIEVGYEASFNSHYLSMDKGGLLMAWPSLFGGDLRYTGVEVEGPRHMSRFEQSDSWEIPSGFDELEKSDLEHDLARGKWTRKGGEVRRSYAVEVSVVPADKRDVLADYLRRKNKFARATLWHR